MGLLFGLALRLRILRTARASGSNQFRQFEIIGSRAAVQGTRAPVNFFAQRPSFTIIMALLSAGDAQIESVAR